jgi:hypothetical protein
LEGIGAFPFWSLLGELGALDGSKGFALIFEASKNTSSLFFMEGRKLS